MATKAFKELKNLSKDELTTKLRDSEGQLFQLRMKRVTGQTSDTASLWKTRKSISRMKMLLGQMDKTSGSAAGIK